MRIYRFPLVLASWSVRHPRWVLSLGVVLTVIAGLLAQRLALHNDLVELLPAGMEQVKTIRRIIKETGGLGTQSVVVRSPSKEKNRAFLKDLRAALRKKTLPLDDDAQEGKPIDQQKQAQKKKSLATSRPLAAKPLISYAFFGYDTEALRQRQLYFLSVKDLREVQQRIQKKVRYEVRKRQPGYVDLMGDDDPGLDLRDIEKKYQANSFQQSSGLLEVREGDLFYTALIIRPNGNQTDLFFARAFVKELERTVAALGPSRYHSQLRVQLLGSYTNAVHEFFGISRDLSYTGILTVVLLLLILFAFFREFGALWLLGIPLGMGALWAFAFAYLWIGFLTTATGFIGVVILGLGIDYGVYFLQRFRQEYDEQGDFFRAIESCYLWTGKAIATSALTTAMAFFSLIVCRFTGFSQFGVIASVGVMCCLLTMITILPALLALEHRWWPRKASLHPRTEDISDTRPVAFARSWVVVAGLLVVSVVYSYSRIPFEYHMKKLSFQDRGLVEHEREWERFAALYPIQNMNPIVYLIESEKEARRLVERIEQMRSAWSKHRDEQGRVLVKGAFSALTFVPEHQQEKYKILQEIQAFLKKRDIEDWVQGEVKKTYQRYKKMLEAKPYTVLDLPDYVRNDLVLADAKQPNRIRGYLVIVQSDADYSHGKRVIQVDNLLKSLEVDGRVYLPSGGPIIAGELMRLINLDSLVAILASFLTSFLLVWLDLRNLRLALMSLWPLLSGMLGMALVLVIFDVRLNIFNMVVLPSLLGIGIDAGVHLLHRYRERVSLGIRGVLRELRGAIIVASVTTLVSFASMFFAHHRGIRSIGEVAVIGLFACFFGSLVFLPALMQVVFERFPLTEQELLVEKEE